MGFQTLETCKKPAVGVCCKDHLDGAQVKVPTPVVPAHVVGHVEDETRSSPALIGSGNAYSLPLFYGVDSREFVSWLYAIESHFEANMYSEIKKCEMVLLCLRNDALSWYNGVTYAKKRNGTKSFKYWHKLKCSLKHKFLSKSVIELRNEFQDLKMNSLCVKDYTMMFNELYFILGSPNDSSMKMKLFYNGLNSEDKDWINIEHIRSFGLLCELALMSESLIHEHDVYMESLFKENAEHIVVMSFSKGVCNEVALIHRETLSNKGAVQGTVTTQGVVLDQKLDHEPDVFDLACSDSLFVSQNTEEHAYGDGSDPLSQLKSTSKGLLLYKGCCNLMFWCLVSHVVAIRPRHFILIYDPGGIDEVPSLEVAFEQMSLNILTSFKEMPFKVIRISLFSIMSWCGLWSIAKFEVKFLLNQGCLQQELRYGYVIFQSIESKMPLTTQETNPQGKEHQNWTFCFDSRIMVMLFAPYLEFNLVKICVLYMVQFLKISSFKWLWNEQVSLSSLLRIELQISSQISEAWGESDLLSQTNA